MLLRRGLRAVMPGSLLQLLTHLHICVLHPLFPASALVSC